MRYLSILISVFISTLIINSVKAQYQEGHFIATDYKLGYTRLSNAYTTYNPSLAATVPQQSDYTSYSDAFLQNNLSVYYGYQTENFYFKTNIDGLFNWVTYANSRYYYMRSSFRKLDDIQSKNAFISQPEKGEKGYILHPVNGVSDYKMLNADLLFGNENIKIGTNFSVGMLGAAMNDGVRLNQGTRHPEIRTMTLGYYQIGIKTLLSNVKDMPLTASIGLNKLKGFDRKGNDLTKEERRSGFGIDFEAKYYLGDNQFRPYVSFYGELKRFTKEAAKVGYQDFRTTRFVEIEIPALNTLAFGLTLGFVIGEL